MPERITYFHHFVVFYFGAKLQGPITTTIEFQRHSAVSMNDFLAEVKRVQKRLGASSHQVYTR